MTIKDRIIETEKKFEQVRAQQEEYLVEMNRLQGEYRLLKELEADEEQTINRQAEVIEAVPEKSKK